MFPLFHIRPNRCLVWSASFADWSSTSTCDRENCFPCNFITWAGCFVATELDGAQLIYSLKRAINKRKVLVFCGRIQHCEASCFSPTLFLPCCKGLPHPNVLTYLCWYLAMQIVLVWFGLVFRYLPSSQYNGFVCKVKRISFAVLKNEKVNSNVSFKEQCLYYCE